jgi:hypothetical protein
MPCIQTSITLEEQIELHTRAMRAGKPVQRFLYEIIREWLNKQQLEDKANVGRETSEKAGKGN